MADAEQPIPPTTANEGHVTADERKSALIFGGSKPGMNANYTLAAAKVGELLAVTYRKPVVYGGGTVGVMGAMAQAVVAHGGSLHGIIPRALAPKEISGDTTIGRLTLTDTMSERKELMFKESGWVIALPGGIGTMDELLEVLTLYQLNAYQPRIGLLDVDGFYQPLLTCLRHLIATGFLNDDAMEYVVVESDPDVLLAKMEAGYGQAPPCIDLQWGKKE